MILYTDIWKMT